MMKFFFLLFFYFFIFNKLNKKFIMLMYQVTLIMIFLIFLFNYNLNLINVWIKLYNLLGMDNYSLILILMSIWIMMIVILINYNYKNNLLLINLMNLLLMILILCFSILNLMMFYFYFEISLLPIFFMIIGWGGQVERIQASIYMMLYTLFGSMPLFVMIIYLYSIEFFLMMNLMKIKLINLYMYMGMILAFLIKMPMYLMHLWLPKAHVEAPVFGSMILAGIMLKLGSYGLIRVMFMMSMLNLNFNKFIIVISLLGGMLSSLICLIQVDMKMLVAYSSIVHMSLLMAGILSLFSMGMLGGLMMMVAHGLCSSGLFYIVNIYYMRLNSRSFYINKGLINYYPSMGLMMFMMCSSNMSFPPSLNLFSEIFLLNSLIMWNNKLMLLLMILLFFSAFYSLFLFSFSQHGKFNLLNKMLMSVKILEYYVILIHWIPLNLMFFSMLMFM